MSRGRAGAVGVAMNGDRERCSDCGYRRAYEIQVNSLNEDLRELKQRVGRLETTLARGVMLLVMNLIAVIVSLAQQLMNA